MQCSLLAGEAMFGFKLAYDESLARHGPGTQLMAASASFFHERAELQWADSCTEPNTDAIERLWPDRRALATVVVPGELAGSGAMRAQAAFLAALRTRYYRSR
jgi:hypothetical protein